MEGDLHTVELNMAIITVTFTPALVFTPWTDAPGAPKDPSPVGELNAGTAGGSMTLSGAGDTQEARWTVTLPANYSWVLTDVALSMQTATAGTNSWPDLQNAQYFDGNTGLLYALGLISDGVMVGQGSLAEIQAYRLRGDKPTFMQKAGAIWQFTLVNLTAEEPVGIFNAHARFLAYTIDQEFDTRINTPVLTR